MDNVDRYWEAKREFEALPIEQLRTPKGYKLVKQLQQARAAMMKDWAEKSKEY